LRTADAKCFTCHTGSARPGAVSLGVYIAP
jgi:hypothetical protein